MEMKHSSASHEPKRKAQKEESNDSTILFKKARHELQIKGVESNNDNKVHQCPTTDHPSPVRTDHDLVTTSKLQEDASSTISDSIADNGASYVGEIKHVSNPDFPSQGHIASSDSGRKRGDFSPVSFNGHPEGTFESQKYRENSACVDAVVSDRTTSNNSLQACEKTQTTGSSPPEFQATDQSDIDTNLESEGSYFGLSSSLSSNSSRRGYNPRSSTTSSTNSNELQFNSFLAKRQNSHIAKAVVDNAINKTLEDMGVSPDTNSFDNGKCNVENAGISQAIQSQGLIPQHQNIQSQGLNSQHQTTQSNEDLISQHQAAVCNAALTPIISHVTHLSDMLFSQRQLTFQPGYLTDTRDIIIDQNSAFAATSVATTVSVSSSDLLDQAVSMAISSQGLALQRDVL